MLPVVTNGIPLSKIHHAAFDAHLIGIDPDFRMHVSDRLLRQNDGPMLEALKQRNATLPPLKPLDTLLKISAEIGARYTASSAAD